VGHDHQRVLPRQIDIDQQGIESRGCGFDPRDHQLAFDITLRRRCCPGRGQQPNAEKRTPVPDEHRSPYIGNVLTLRREYEAWVTFG